MMIIDCNVFSAVVPPSTSTAAAINPSIQAQNTRCVLGEFSLPPLVKLSTTRLPESLDVTKNKIIAIMAIKLNPRITKLFVVILFIITNKLVDKSFAIASDINPFFTSSKYNPVDPSIVITKEIITVGIIVTPMIICLIDLPLEILAINNPTKGLHENHQAQ